MVEDEFDVCYFVVVFFKVLGYEVVEVVDVVSVL